MCFNAIVSHSGRYVIGIAASKETSHIIISRFSITGIENYKNGHYNEYMEMIGCQHKRMNGFACLNKQILLLPLSEFPVPEYRFYRDARMDAL